jgi:hypothetical protein
MAPWRKSSDHEHFVDLACFRKDRGGELWAKRSSCTLRAPWPPGERALGASWSSRASYAFLPRKKCVAKRGGSGKAPRRALYEGARRAWRQGTKNMDKCPWPRLAPTCRFHAPRHRFQPRKLAWNQPGAARHQKHGKKGPPLATKGQRMSLPCKKLIKERGAPKTWKRALATMGPTLSLPCKKSIKEAWGGGRGKARRTWSQGQASKSPKMRRLATKGPNISLPRGAFIKKPGGRGTAPRTWTKSLWPRRASKRCFHTGNVTRDLGNAAGQQKHGKAPLATRAPKCRFHARNLSRSQGGMARPQKHGKAPPGHEGPKNAASTQETYQETSGAWQGTTNMEKGALATKCSNMSLPRQKSIKEPGGRGKAAKTWKSAPGHEGPENAASTQEIDQGTGGPFPCFCCLLQVPASLINFLYGSGICGPFVAWVFFHVFVACCDSLFLDQFLVWKGHLWALRGPGALFHVVVACCGGLLP